MNEQIKIEVDYLEYCHQCKHYDLPGHFDPCNDCLVQPYNYNTNKPICFEKGEVRQAKKKIVRKSGEKGGAK